MRINKHMTRWTIFLVHRDVHNKSTMRYSTPTNVDEIGVTEQTRVLVTPGPPALWRAGGQVQLL